MTDILIPLKYNTILHRDQFEYLKYHQSGIRLFDYANSIENDLSSD